MADEIRLDVGQESNQVSTDQKRNWIKELDEKFKNMKSNLKTKQMARKKQQPEKREKTMCKIPANMRREFDDLYAPYMVSFGPYYHGKESYRSTEDIKEDVVRHSLERSNKTIYDYEKALRKDLKDLKDKYDELDPKWQQEDEAFLKLMIFDGCFFLEILRAANDDNISDSPVRDIDRINPNKLMEDYRHDMLLLENQLPLLVLEKLFDVQTDKPKNFILDKIQKVDAQEYLYGHILEFFFPNVNLKIPSKNCLHVLDLYRHSLLSQEPKGESKVQCLWRIVDSSMLKFICSLTILILLFLLVPILWVILTLVDMIRFSFKLLKYIFKTQQATKFQFNFPSALDLDKVGIGFTSKTKSLRDISYGRRTLRLPQASVDGTAKSIFFNITAFEQLHKDAETEVTSYVYFMSSLIKGVDDVRHLQRCGVIDTRLPADQIVKLFDSLSRGINVDDPKSFIVPRYREVSERLTNGYYKMNKPWQKDLWQTYLRSPWAFVSIFAAFFIFALTTVQTVYTVLGYYNSK